MAKKIILEQFTGVTPRVPNHALSDRAASAAINARLSDSTIRPFYEPIDSIDANSDLSGNFNGYTNFFKASTDDTLAWMSWTVDRNISVLEVRYNDIDRYDYPVAPEITVEGGVLSVILEGVSPTVVVLIGDNNYTASYTYTHTSNYAPAAATVPLLNLTRQVTTSLAFLIGGAAVSTYAWTFVSGDATITIDNIAIINPTFTCASLDAPDTVGTNNTRSAVYEVAVTDTSANVGTRQITVNFTYSWVAETSWDGDGDWCVWAEAFMPHIGYAGIAANAVVGDSVVVLNEAHEGTEVSDINAIAFEVVPCVTLRTVSGIELTCSTTTPLTLKDNPEIGVKILATDALGVHVPVLDGGDFRWEPVVEVKAAGNLEAAKISCHDQVYAAGNKQDKYILTHNTEYYKP